MTWVINTDGNGEIVETVQDNPTPNMLAPIMPALAPAAPTPAPHRARRSIDQDDLIASVDWVTNGLTKCLSLAESILNQCTNGDVTPALQGHHTTNVDHPAHAHRPRWQDEDLVIMATSKGRTVQRRPLPAPTESMPKPYSFGLVGAGPICQDTVHHLFAKHTKHSHTNDLYQIDFPEAD